MGLRQHGSSTAVPTVSISSVSGTNWRPCGPGSTPSPQDANRNDLRAFAPELASERPYVPKAMPTSAAGRAGVAAVVLFTSALFAAEPITVIEPSDGTVLR